MIGDNSPSNLPLFDISSPLPLSTTTPTSAVTTTISAQLSAATSPISDPSSTINPCCLPQNDPTEQLSHSGTPPTLTPLSPKSPTPLQKNITSIPQLSDVSSGPSNVISGVIPLPSGIIPDLPKESSTSVLQSTKTSVLPPIKDSKVTWAKVVAPGKESLHKFEVTTQLHDGTTSALIPEDILQDPNPLWKSFIVGRFLDTAPHIAKIHVIVNKIWTFGDKNQKIDVQTIDDKTIKFRIRDAAARFRILHRGLWNIADIPMVVNEWSPDAVKEIPALKTIPIWVEFRKVPSNLFSYRGLSWLASHVGHPIRLHPHTETCSSFDKAKIFIDVKLESDLPKKISLSSLSGISAEVAVDYPWLPPKCENCNKWGHKGCRPTSEERSAGESTLPSSSKQPNQTGITSSLVSHVLLNENLQVQNSLPVSLPVTSEDKSLEIIKQLQDSASPVVVEVPVETESQPSNSVPETSPTTLDITEDNPGVENSISPPIVAVDIVNGNQVAINSETNVTGNDWIEVTPSKACKLKEINGGSLHSHEASPDSQTRFDLLQEHDEEENYSSSQASEGLQPTIRQSLPREKKGINKSRLEDNPTTGKKKQGAQKSKKSRLKNHC